MSSSTQALCLLLLVAIVTFAAHVGAASAAKPLPGSCLTAASTLCANADTNAMRCLRKLVIKGDARVPTACSEAMMAGVAMNPQGPQRPRRTARDSRLARLLSEGVPGTCATAGNSCPGTFASTTNLCNDVKGGCGNCPKGTFTIPSGTSFIYADTINNSNVRCSNICCKAGNGANAGCFSSSFTTTQGAIDDDVWCTIVP